MYITSNLSSFVFLLFSAVLGVFLGVFFDILRTVRRFLRNIKFLTFFLDIIFFVVSAVVAYLYMLISSNGQVRLFVLAGMAAGFFLYRLTISLYVYRGAVWLIRNMAAILKKILAPMLKIGSKFIKTVRFRLKKLEFLKKLKVFVKKHLKNGFKLVYTKRRKITGRKGVQDVKESENQISLVEKYFD